MEYSDWIESGKSKRVWLADSMTALAQFAYVNPIQRVMHWDNKKKRRGGCYADKYEKCYKCEGGVAKIYDYAYGIFTSDEGKDIRYLSTALTTHKDIQREFARLFEENINPCSILFEIQRGQIKTMTGRKVNGYSCTPMIEINEEGITAVMSPFIGEVDRPSPFPEDATYVVPRMIADGLLSEDNKPFDLIALFLLMKDKFPKYKDTELKQYAIRLINNGSLDLRKAIEDKPTFGDEYRPTVNRSEVKLPMED